MSNIFIDIINIIIKSIINNIFIDIIIKIIRFHHGGNVLFINIISTLIFKCIITKSVFFFVIIVIISMYVPFQ